VLGLAALAPGRALAAPRPVLGANIDLSLLDPAARSTALDRLSAAGVSSVRMQLDWSRAEPRPGKFKWEAFDDAVDAARAHGMDVVLVLGPCAEWAVNPAWQVPPDQRRNSVPKSPELWRNYVKAAVSHFRNRVECWQIREQPNARNFRGARSEYLALLIAASRQIRSLDPKARVIAPEAGYLDIAGIDHFLRSASARSAQIVGVYLACDPARAALPWAVLTNEIMASGGEAAGDASGPAADGRAGAALPHPREAGRARPVWVLGIQEGASPDACETDFLLAWAFGDERCYLPSDSISAEWTWALLGLTYEGFASPAPGAWMVFFSGPSGHIAVAWSSAETTICPPTKNQGTGEQESEKPAADTSVSPAPPAVEQELAPAPLKIGPRPMLFPAGDWLAAMRPGAPKRADVLASRGCADLSALPMVYMDLSMPQHPELGLSNRALRALGGGACVEEQRQGRSCVRTSMTSRQEELEQDNPWLYFDVDDSWLYYDGGKTRAVVTVECEGSYMGPKKLGFNILYDSTTGYRFTPWRWIEPGSQWRSYRVELSDVNFSNRDGWDFRINAKGSVQDLWVSAVTVEKAPTPEPAAAAWAGAPAP